MTGTVVLSMEVELAWGLARLEGDGFDRHSPERAAETRTLERLLDACDEHDLPISFDVVGHLLHRSCDGSHDGPLPEDWFADDPGTSVDDDPLYYAPDLVDAIRDADADHELATHTYSHPRCDLAEAPTVAWELEAAREAHEAAGCRAPRSLVPPMHGPPPTSVVRDAGVTGVREPVRLRPPVASPSPPDSRLAALASRVRESHPVQVLGRRHPVRSPAVRDGVVRHYTSWHASLSAPYLPNGARPPHPTYRVLPTRVRQAIHGRYLRRALSDAAASDGYAHLWTHLFNVSNEAQWSPLESFLERLAARRDAGDVRVTTMASLSEEVLADRA